MEPLFPSGDASAGNREVYSVSEITTEIKVLLNGAFSSVWIEGEISNFTHHFASGHMYFTLRDEGAELRAAMFKGYNQYLKFPVEDGMKVLAHGDISLYEARGQYQLLVKRMEPSGVGTLYLAFEALKEKLEAEGLFDESRKKPLPAYPFKIGIATSGTGAAMEDMKTIFSRRAPHIMLLIRPTLVQGNGAAEDIVSAITEFDRRDDLDLIIIGRGGGSLEDLWAFNEEKVVRQISDCTTPIISAVGHETDFTLSDFVADLRAPTPSAAAELASPSQIEISAWLDHSSHRLGEVLRNRIEKAWQRIDGLSLRYGLKQPKLLLGQERDRLEAKKEKMMRNIDVILAMKSTQFKSLRGQLEAVSPTAILKRGYAIARTLPHGKILRSPSETELGDRFGLTLASGELEGEVKKITGE
ncbi:MAG: exodeoxyribonuclease VII large subunit [Candidatus Marinimicrobia bacterium]|nr:exodeoxyribonuclease VII large subunit [Candidatus Neomarinimicrobiota bacterium]|tara:strand:- start:3766 stop:5007 length:1242 start_codon:yes stop_codon:yes gene_type:complete